MAELWVPPEASTDDLVARVHQQVARFAEREQCAHVLVEVQLHDGGAFKLDALSPDPGYGFVTLRPHSEGDGEREELIVPLASIALIRIAPAAAEPRFGFGLPDEAASPRPAP
jgi:hypothetical protein